MADRSLRGQSCGILNNDAASAVTYVPKEPSTVNTMQFIEHFQNTSMNYLSLVPFCRKQHI